MPDAFGAALEAPLFDRLCVIGLGLIGSSIARVARQKGLARSIVAADADADVRKRVIELGLADKVAETAELAVHDADLVILCVPVGAIGEVARAIAPHLSRRRHSLRCRLGESVGDRRCRAASADGPCISCPPIPSPARSNPVPTPALPACSAIAGAF